VGVLSLVGLFFADPIVGLFAESTRVVEVGAFALRAASVGSLFLPLSVPVNMLYQSIRKAGVASFLSLLRSGLAMIPALLIGSYFLGLTGIQIAQPLADALTGLISIPFILHFLYKTPNTEQ